MGVIVVGSFMYDLMVEAPRRPELGETLRGTAFRRSVGGKGFNQAVASARAGARTEMVGMLGEDPFGAEFRSVMDAEGIISEHVTSCVEGHSGTGVGMPVVYPDGNNSIIIIPRANEEMGVPEIEDAAESIENADVLLMQLEIPNDAVLRAAEIGHRAGTKVVLNPAPFRDLPPRIWALVDLFTPNEGELRAFCRSLGLGGEGPIDDLAKAFAGRLDVEVVITLGDAGLLRVKPAGAVEHIRGHRVHAVDTVGAGDTFCGALCAQLAQGIDLSQALEFANAAAALSVTRAGSGTSSPSVEDVQSILINGFPEVASC